MKNCPKCSSPGDDLIFNFYCSNQDCSNYRDKEQIIEDNGKLDVDEIADSLIKREVFVCQTHLVNDFLSDNMHEDVINLYPPIDGLSNKELKEMCSEYLIDSDHMHRDDMIDDLIDTMNPQEIYEWWSISSWLGEKLVDLGEPVLDNDYGVWWGRTCTDQCMSLDGTFQQIAKGLMK